LARILCVDDDPGVLNVMRRTLVRAGHDVLTQPTVDDAYDVVRHGVAVDVIVSDYQMPDATGLDLLDRLKAGGYQIPLIIVTGHATIEHAVTCLKAGARDYLVKPFQPQQLEIVVEHALEVERLRLENEELRSQVRSFTAGSQIVGESPALGQILDLLRAVATTRATILLQGESGTGKEVLAHAVHEMSGRLGPFVSINCAALPEALVESILFGHEKGAFTGAVRQVKGAFERADRGTLLLDEVSEMRIDLQAKLLRVLQEQEFERVGGSGPIRVDTRIVATTNRDLLEDVRNGRFREDLYYRLAVVPVRVPPLRERLDDIPQLAMHFLTRAARELDRHTERISPEGIELLQSYHWPGNVRELAHLVERAVILGTGPVLSAGAFALPRAAPSNGAREEPEAGRENGVTLPTFDLAEAERILIERALEATNQNRTRAAELLGVSIRTLRNKLNRPHG
jgi:DNA-binding NtrC family response regulator